MFLHEDKEQFRTMIGLAVQYTNMPEIIIEKDYYVTMILLLLSQKMPFVVFKGGTSLSKCYKAIRRFSEDIDISIDSSLSQGQKSKLKHALAEVAEELGMTVLNLERTKSRRNYNRYEIAYKSVMNAGNLPFSGVVLVEVTYATVSFPTVTMPVTSYIGEAMEEEAPERISEYRLNAFEMKVQGIERTLIDKVFAICDYYLQNRVQRHSRHIYDIYKLLPLVEMDEKFRVLVHEVREERKRSGICPSASDDVEVPLLLQTIIEHQVYREDYQNVTTELLEEDVSYDMAILAVEKVLKSSMFDRP